MATLPKRKTGWHRRMTAIADFWKRAFEWLASARNEAGINQDASASCAYYAALYALSALFALERKIFTSHDGVEIVLHRDFIRPGILPREVADHFRKLRSLRKIGNYGCENHVSQEEATQGVELARAIIEAVYNLKSEELTRPDWMQKT